MDKKQSKQQKIDAEAIADHKAVGSDNPGGQDHISPPRLSHPNDEPKFKGIRFHRDPA